MGERERSAGDPGGGHPSQGGPDQFPDRARSQTQASAGGEAGAPWEDPPHNREHPGVCPSVPPLQGPTAAGSGRVPGGLRGPGSAGLLHPLCVPTHAETVAPLEAWRRRQEAAVPPRSVSTGRLCPPAPPAE